CKLEETSLLMAFPSFFAMQICPNFTCIKRKDFERQKKKLIVFFGAGVSVESGLKTFRDSDGLWEGYDVTEVATPGAWRKNPQLVLDFYNMRRRDVAGAQPNTAHYGL